MQRISGRNGNCQDFYKNTNVTIRTCDVILYIDVFTVLNYRHCATSRKVAGSIPDGVSGIFH